MALNDFHVSEPYTLGIELEMQVINPPGYDLSQDSSTLIDTVKPQLTAVGGQSILDRSEPSGKSRKP